MSDLEQDEKPTAWKSMDSAPKDGREILVRLRHFGFISHEIGCWSETKWIAQDGRMLPAERIDAWTDIPS